MEGAAIEYTRPERDKHDPTMLDYYLPRFRMYVELKQFHTDRIAKQLANVPDGFNVMVLVGRTAVVEFVRFVAAATGQQES